MTIKLTNTTTRHEGSDKVITTTVEEVVPHHVMIERLHDQIMEAGPHHFDMETWFSNRGQDGFNDLSFVLPEWDDHGKMPDFTHCGTTGCLAGHAAVFARHNDITDYIMQGGELGARPVVNNDKILRLLGTPWGVFSTASHNWHPVAQAAFHTDLTAAVKGVVWLANDSYGYDDDDNDAWDGVPVNWADVAYGRYHTERIVDDGDIEISEEWATAAKHHAEWVAICTYLRYLATMSATMDGGGDTDVYAEQDMESVTHSPAFGHREAPITDSVEY